MLEQVTAILANWHNRTGERQKLQHTYMVAAVVMTFGAGLVSLVEPELGQDLVKLAVLAIVVYLVNGVIWNLLQSGLLLKLENRQKPSFRKPRRK